MQVQIALVSVTFAASLACGRAAAAPSRSTDSGAAGVQGRSAPTRFTAEANAAVAHALPLEDPQDFEDASARVSSRARRCSS